MRLLKFLIILFISTTLFSQNLIGAWERIENSENGNKLKHILIVAEGYQVLSTFDAYTGKFIATNGGSWSLIGNKMTEKVEFHTQDTSKIGRKFSFDIELKKNSLKIVGTNQVFRRIDNGIPGKLKGSWIMSGRVRNGKTQLRDTNRPRKTMKILSGTRFQWIAYNTKTKEFKGTGGGTYTTIDGKYTENIEFFSKDNSKVGKSLEFDYQLIQGKWHHSGLSSKGNLIHEIWSIRN